MGDEVNDIFCDSEMRELLEALEISARDSRSMFKLLDLDSSGGVDINEFCEGCIRLKGEANSFDVNCLMYENKRLITKTTSLMGRLEELFADLDRSVRHSAHLTSEKLTGLSDGIRHSQTGPQRILVPNIDDDDDDDGDDNDDLDGEIQQVLF